MINAHVSADVGPLQALIDELQFNAKVAEFKRNTEIVPCQFLEDQFKRAIQHGSIAILEDALKESIHNTYFVLRNANLSILASIKHEYESTPCQKDIKNAYNFIEEAQPKIAETIDKLMQFLGHEASLRDGVSQDATPS